MRKTILVGESRDRRCKGVISERKIISSVMGPWESRSAGRVERHGKTSDEWRRQTTTKLRKPTQLLRVSWRPCPWIQPLHPYSTMPLSKRGPAKRREVRKSTFTTSTIDMGYQPKTRTTSSRVAPAQMVMT